MAVALLLVFEAGAALPSAAIRSCDHGAAWTVADDPAADSKSAANGNANGGFLLKVVVKRLFNKNSGEWQEQIEKRGQVSRAPSSEEAKGVKRKIQAGGDTPLATTAVLA